jgi:hypothetical protein
MRSRSFNIAPFHPTLGVPIDTFWGLEVSGRGDERYSGESLDERKLVSRILSNFIFIDLPDDAACGGNPLEGSGSLL